MYIIVCHTLTLEQLGEERNDLHWYTLLHCFLTFSKLIQISWNVVTFPQIYQELIFWIFFQNSNLFLQYQNVISNI